MTAIPPNTVEDPTAELAKWYELKKQLDIVKAAESLLRKRLFGHFFPNPVEGTNTYALPAGFNLKGKHVINREVDEGALAGLKLARVGEMAQHLSAFGFDPADMPADELVLTACRVPVDGLVRWKPELNLRAYRTLTAEQTKLFDLALVVKEGSASLEIVADKKAAAASEDLATKLMNATGIPAPMEDS